MRAVTQFILNKLRQYGLIIIQVGRGDEGHGPALIFKIGEKVVCKYLQMKIFLCVYS